MTIKRFVAPLLLTPRAALLAQAPPDIQARLTAVEAAAKSAQSAGDNAWMLVSATLVLMMTGPGLALFYGGLVRGKKTLAMQKQSLVLDGVYKLAQIRYPLVGLLTGLGLGLVGRLGPR